MEQTRKVKVTGHGICRIIEISHDKEDNWFDIGNKILRKICYVRPEGTHVIIGFLDKEYKVEIEEE
jgi:hypothetical protein